MNLTSLALGITAAAVLQSCGPTYPGGLTEAEFNSLPPEKRAQLKIEQEKADAAKMENIEHDLDRYERQREFNEINKSASEPSVNLTKKQQRELNRLSY